jgi:hypothetical protein
MPAPVSAARRWWRARQLLRRACCFWCRDLLAPGQPAAPTGRGRLVHAGCQPEASAFEYDMGNW